MTAQNITGINDTAITIKKKVRIGKSEECLPGGIFVGPEVVILSFAGNFFSKVSFHRKQGHVIGNIREL